MTYIRQTEQVFHDDTGQCAVRVIELSDWNVSFELDRDIPVAIWLHAVDCADQVLGTVEGVCTWIALPGVVVKLLVPVDGSIEADHHARHFLAVNCPHLVWLPQVPWLFAPILGSRHHLDIPAGY